MRILTVKGNGRSRSGFVRFAVEDDALCAEQYMNNVIVDGGNKLTVRYDRSNNNGGNKTGRRSMRQANGVRTSSNTSSETSPAKSVKEDTSGSGKKGESFKVLVVHVDSPIKFWGQRYDAAQATSLADLSEELEKTCPTLDTPKGQLSLSTVCHILF